MQIFEHQDHMRGRQDLRIGVLKSIPLPKRLTLQRHFNAVYFLIAFRISSTLSASPKSCRSFHRSF